MHPLLIVVTVGVGLLFIGLSIPLIKRRIPPNGLYGLRVPATFADQWVWYEANARSARDLLYLGVLLVALAIVLPISGLGAIAYIIWAIVAGVGAITMGVIGWLRANRLLRERRHSAQL